MLSSLALDDFKSFAHAELKLANLTLLVGANASGKSNIFDAMRFLQALGQGLTVADALRGRWEGGRELWPGLRGGGQEVARAGTDRFAIGSRWGIGPTGLDHSIECKVGVHPHVTRESLSAPGLDDSLFDTNAAWLGSSGGLLQGGAINVALKHKGSSRLSSNLSSTRSLLDQIEPQPGLDPYVVQMCSAVATAMRGPLFLDISTRRMRDYVPRSASEIGAQGENLSAAVWAFCQDADRKRTLVDWLSELCAPRLADIDFVETELGDVMLVLEEADGTRVSARSLSDGTLRFLGELVALFSAREGSIVLIEEIENGLHPARVQLLVELLTTVTRDNRVQVIATTHSARVLEALGDVDADALRHVVVCGRIDGAPGTQVRRLGDLPSFDDVRKRRGVDHLFTTQWFERAL
jgi:predicted ATPase